MATAQEVGFRTLKIQDEFDKAYAFIKNDAKIEENLDKLKQEIKDRQKTIEAYFEGDAILGLICYSFMEEKGYVLLNKLITKYEDPKAAEITVCAIERIENIAKNKRLEEVTFPILSEKTKLCEIVRKKGFKERPVPSREENLSCFFKKLDVLDQGEPCYKKTKSDGFSVVPQSTHLLIINREIFDSIKSSKTKEVSLKIPVQDLRIIEKYRSGDLMTITYERKEIRAKIIATNQEQEKGGAKQMTESEVRINLTVELVD